MVVGERLTITLTGGTPWGFRLQGGGNFPLEVAKVRKKSKASDGNLREGDIVVSINGIQLQGKTHESAMGVVETASDTLTFEVIRTGRSGEFQVTDPQRVPRSVTVAQEGKVKSEASPGLVSSHTAMYVSPDGSERRQIHTEEYRTESGGSDITRIVTQKRMSSDFTTKSPVTFQPPKISAARSYENLRKSPLTWQPKTLSQTQSQSNIPMQISPAPSHENIKPPQVWQPTSISPSSSHRSLPQPMETEAYPSYSEQSQGKENVDPYKQQGPNVPVFNIHTFSASQPQLWQPRDESRMDTTSIKADDLLYPMFEVPKPNWKPTKQLSDSNLSQSSLSHSVSQPQSVSPKPSPSPALKPAPPPPPPPPPPKPTFFKPTTTFLPPHHYTVPAIDEHNIPEDPEGLHEHPKDHLPVFAPRVEITIGSLDRQRSDSGYPESSNIPLERMDSLAESDTSSQAMSKTSFPGKHSGKLYSDSAFYDDPFKKYPTIQEQMQMCKLIAQSLTSAVNRRARGARMFAKRKRKSTKWVHEGHLYGFSSEYSSSAGDVADLNDLDSELSPTEGGTRPLFTFRIPKVASRTSEPAVKMSLSKEEFERLRLGNQRCEHQGVSPNQCFTLAADLHSSKNRGAKLFQKRQAKSENWVVDEYNANKPLANVPQNKLEHILGAPLAGKPQTPWDRTNNMRPMQPAMQDFKPIKQHKLLPESQLKTLEGPLFNQKAKGWGMDSPDSATRSFRQTQQTTYSYSQTVEPSMAPQPPPPPPKPQKVQFGDYNARVKAWGGPPPETTHYYSEQQYYGNQQMNYGQPYELPSCDL